MKTWLGGIDLRNAAKVASATAAAGMQSVQTWRGKPGSRRTDDDGSEVASESGSVSHASITDDSLRQYSRQTEEASKGRIDVNHLRQELKLLRSRLHVLEAQAEEAVGHAEENGKLRAEVSTLRTQLSELQQISVGVSADVALRTEMQQLQEVNKKLHDRLGMRDAQIQTLKNTNSKLRALADEAEHRATASTSADLARLQTELEASRQFSDQLAAELRAWQSKAGEYEAKIGATRRVEESNMRLQEQVKRLAVQVQQQRQRLAQVAKGDTAVVVEDVGKLELELEAVRSEYQLAGDQWEHERAVIEAQNTSLRSQIASVATSLEDAMWKDMDALELHTRQLKELMTSPTPQPSNPPPRIPSIPSLSSVLSDPLSPPAPPATVERVPDPAKVPEAAGAAASPQEASQQLAQLQAQVIALKTRADLAERYKAKLATDMADAREKLSAAQQQVQQLTTSLDLAQSQSDTYRTQSVDLESELDSARKQISDLSSLIDKQSGPSEAVVEQVDTGKKLQEAEKKVVELQRKLKETEEKLRQGAEKLSSAETAAAKSASELSAVVKRLEKEKDLVGELKEQVDDMGKRMADAQQRAAELEHELQVKERRVATVTERVVLLSEAEHKASHIEDRMVQLQDDLLGAKDLVVAAEQRATAAESRVSELESKVEEAEKEAETYAVELTEAQAASSQLQEDYDKLRKNLEELAEKKWHVDKKVKELQSREEELAEMRVSIERLNAEVRILATERRELLGKLKAEQNEHRVARQMLDDMRTMKRSYSVVKSENERLIKQLNENAGEENRLLSASDFYTTISQVRKRMAALMTAIEDADRADTAVQRLFNESMRLGLAASSQVQGTTNGSVRGAALRISASSSDASAEAQSPMRNGESISLREDLVQAKKEELAMKQAQSQAEATILALRGENERLRADMRELQRKFEEGVPVRPGLGGLPRTGSVRARAAHLERHQSESEEVFVNPMFSVGRLPSSPAAKLLAEGSGSVISPPLSRRTSRSSLDGGQALLEADYALARERVEKLQSSNSELQAQISELVASRDEALARVLELEGAATRLEKLEEAYSTAVSGTTQLTNLMSQLEESAGVISGEFSLAKQMAAAAEEAIVNQRVQLKAAERQLQKGVEKVEAAVEQQSASIKTVLDLEARVRDLKNRLEGVENEKKSALEEAEELRKHLEDQEGALVEEWEREEQVGRLQVENDKLRDRWQEAVRKVEAVEGELVAVREENARLVAKWEEAKRRVEEAESRLAGEGGKLREENEKLAGRYQEAKRKVEDADGEVSRLRKENEQLARRCDEAVAMAVRLEKDCEQLRRRCEQLSGKSEDLDEAKSEVLEVRRQLVEAEAAAASMQEVVRTLKTQRIELEEKLMASGATENGPTVIQLEEELMGHRAELEESKEETEKLQADLTESKEALEKLQAELDASKEAMQKLELELVESKAAAEAAEGRSREAAEKLQAELAASQLAASLLVGDLADKRAAAEKLEAELEAARKLQAELAGNSDDAATKLKAELSRSQSMGSAMQTELAESKEAARKLQTELARTQEAGETLRAELATNKAAAEKLQAELAETKEAAEKVRARLAENESALEKVSGELCVSKEDVENLRAEVDAVRKLGAAKVGAMGELQEQVEVLSRRAEDGEAVVGRLQGERDALDSELGALEARFKEAVNMRQEAEKARETMSVQLEAAERAAVEAAKHLEEMSSSKASMQGELEALRRYAEKADGVQRSLRDQVESLEQEMNAQRASVSQLREECSALKAQLDVATKRVAELDPLLLQLQQLQEEHQVLKAQQQQGESALTKLKQARDCLAEAAEQANARAIGLDADRAAAMGGLAAAQAMRSAALTAVSNAVFAANEFQVADAVAAGVTRGQAESLCTLVGVYADELVQACPSLAHPLAVSLPRPRASELARSTTLERLDDPPSSAPLSSLSLQSTPPQAFTTPAVNTPTHPQDAKTLSPTARSPTSSTPGDITALAADAANGNSNGVETTVAENGKVGSAADGEAASAALTPSSTAEEVDALSRQLSSTTAELERVRRVASQLGGLDAVRQQLEAQVASLQAEMEQREQHCAEKLSTLQAQLEQARDEQQTLQVQLQSAVEASLSSQESAAGREDEYQQRLALSEAQLHGLNATIAALKDERQELEKRMARDDKECAERVERLQRINKKKGAEVEEVLVKYHANVQKLQTAEAALKDLREAVESKTKEVKELKTRVEATEAAAEELPGIRSQLTITENNLKFAVNERSMLKQEAAAAETRLGILQHEVEKLSEQVVSLQGAQVQRDSLLSEVDHLKTEVEKLRGVEVELAAERKRADGAEAARDRYQTEVSKTSMMLSNLEARVRAVEEDNDALATALDQERTRADSMARQWAADLEVLPSLPRERWPASVRRVVELAELKAEDAAAAAVRADTQSSESHWAEKVEALTAAISEAQDKARAAESAAAAGEAQVRSLQTALNTAERKSQDRLALARAEHERIQQEMQEEASSAVEQLDAKLTEQRLLVEELTQKYEAARDDLAHIKEKTRLLMEEKDEEMMGLRRQLRSSHPSGSDPIPAPAPLPISTQRLVGEPSSPNDSAASANPAELRRRIRDLEAQVQQWRSAMEDAERTALLRDTADSTLKEEIHRLQALQLAGGVDSQYVRSVLLSGFESGELPHDSNMFPVLSRLLHFTPQEVERVMNVERKPRVGRSGTGLRKSQT